MSDDLESSSKDAVLSIKLDPERNEQLRALSVQLGEPVAALAKRLIEEEIEAQHGLTFGPHLRRFMYRS